MRQLKKINLKILTGVLSILLTTGVVFTNCSKRGSSSNAETDYASFTTLSSVELYDELESCEKHKYYIGEISTANKYKCISYFIDTENGIEEANGLHPDFPVKSPSKAINIANAMFKDIGEDGEELIVQFVFVDDQDHAMDSSAITFPVKEVLFMSLFDKGRVYVR